MWRYFRVIPGLAQREPGIHRAAEQVVRWIPGLRQGAHPGMTGGEMPSAIIANAYALADQSGATIHLFEIQMTVQNRNFLFARCD